jgi:hypothetical protein
MGRFTRFVHLLAKVGPPLFVQMRDSGVPVPVDPPAFYKWSKTLKGKERPRVVGCYLAFIMSERYSRAIAAPGAMRHDLDGKPTKPVGERARTMALANIEGIEARRAKRQAAAQKAA